MYLHSNTTKIQNLTAVLAALLVLAVSAFVILLLWNADSNDSHADMSNDLTRVPSDVLGREFPYRLLDEERKRVYYDDRSEAIRKGEEFREFLILIYFPKEFGESITVKTDEELAYSTLLDGDYQEPPDWALAYRLSDPVSIPDGWMLAFRAKDNLMIDTKGIRFTLDLHDLGTYGEIGVDLTKPGVNFVFLRERERPNI